jgi:2-polyprenyl-6-methoxyphenol hydroxylase-like FAD-dependent oxidoreductase
MTSADSETETTDVCIVGAGPVGLALALKLEKLGLTVTLLEMGGGGAAEDAGAGDIEFTNDHHAPSMAMSRPGIGGASALWGGRCVAFDDLDFEARDHVPFSGWPSFAATIRRR